MECEKSSIYLSLWDSNFSYGWFWLVGERVSQIESMSLQAMTVFISPEPDLAIQTARVEAFMKAGVQSVIVQSWALPTKNIANISIISSFPEK